MAPAPKVVEEEVKAEEPVIPPPSVVEAAHQSGHVIRLHVKSIDVFAVCKTQTGWMIVPVFVD